MTMKGCEKCGSEFDDGGFEWKKICKKCFAISKKPKETKQSEVTGFKPATQAPASPEDNKWMDKTYSECFNLVLSIINEQGDSGKVFDGNAFASMVNTLFTRRVGK